MFPYLSKSAGIGGSIKNSPEDFLVEELSPHAGQLRLDAPMKREGQGKFCHFVLQKKSITTTGALVQISRSLGISKSAFSVGGQKDKNAITVQLACARAMEPSRLLSLSLPNIKILGAWNSPHMLKIGDVTGNKFTIKWNAQKKSTSTSTKVSKIYKELRGVFPAAAFPNYFGQQRFGMRNNTHKIGKFLLQGKFRAAVLSYLTDAGEERADMANARTALAATHDYNAALNSFPSILAHERTLLSHLAQFPYDYVGALHKLPNKLPLLFVNAYQSHLFNECLSLRIKEKNHGELLEGEYFCGTNEYGFVDISNKSASSSCKGGLAANGSRAGRFVVSKLLGYDSTPNEMEKEILGREGLSISDFRVRSFPSLSLKGSFRPLLSPLVDFSFKENIFSFSLSSGSYATVTMREFMKN
ncbi:tRNA pseudouridine(13) synthase TruD [Candidatus Micrarchaeota archaeon]|nr:tRNA pseudouridine(13) synthase TruD [Candidatus Micrarchaeota archaeon]